MVVDLPCERSAVLASSEEALLRLFTVLFEAAVLFAEGRLVVDSIALLFSVRTAGLELRAAGLPAVVCEERFTGRVVAASVERVVLFVVAPMVRGADLVLLTSVERVVLFVVAPMVRGADLVLLTSEDRVEVSRRWYSEVPPERAEVLFTCEFPSVRVAVLPFAEATVLVYRSEPALRVSGREYVDL